MAHRKAPVLDMVRPSSFDDCERIREVTSKNYNGTTGKLKFKKLKFERFKFINFLM